MRPAWTLLGPLIFENSCYASPCRVVWALWSESKEIEIIYLSSVLKVSTPQNFMSETKSCTFQKWQICFKVHITFQAFLIIRSFLLFGLSLVYFIHFLYVPLQSDYKILKGRCVCFYVSVPNNRPLRGVICTAVMWHDTGHGRSNTIIKCPFLIMARIMKWAVSDRPVGTH